MQKKILIVDDTKSYLWVISQALEEAGFTVVTASNGEEGLVTVEKEKPDLILLDITMPKMDGMTMAKKIKEMSIDVPIIFLTNMGDMKDISEGSEVAVGYIVKADTSTEDVVVRVKEKLGLK